MKTLWCWLFHARHWRVTRPVYHSYDMCCNKCGREWRFHD